MNPKNEGSPKHPGTSQRRVRRPRTEDGRTPSARILQCAELLREGWHSKGELAERLGVSDRTVKRYLRRLEGEAEGFSHRVSDERGQREYRIRPARFIERRDGTNHEVLALAMAQRFFKAFDPGGVADALDGVLLSMTGEDEDMEDEDGSQRSIARRFVLARAPQPMPGSVRLVFDRVLQALMGQRVLDLTYQPRSGPTKSYVMRPYTLVLGEQELAVTGPVGEPPEDGSARAGEPFRTFSLSRIRSISIRSMRFNMPNLAQWDPERTYSDSWGLWTGEPEEVELLVHPEFDDLLEARRWHPSQRLGEVDDRGWRALHFHVFAGGEFRTWVLGWGPWIEVVKPVSLRHWIDRMRSLKPGDGTPELGEIFRIT